MDFIQTILRSLRDRLSELSEVEQKHLTQLLDINNRLVDSRQSAFDLKTVGTFVTSLLIPIASFILGRLGVLPQKP